MLRSIWKPIGISLLIWALAAGAARAQTAKLDTGDTAFMLLCSALVFFMTPGLAFFYGGMVRRKNVLATLMQSFAAMAVISVTWVIWGYSNAFGPTLWNGLVGGFNWIMLNGVSQDSAAPGYGDTIPQYLHMTYQGMFAIITAALITGGFAERKRFGAWLLFLVLWSSLVYNPLAHWVWAADGWLFKKGALDFAGGTVVHISSGVSALVAAMVLGKRRGYPSEEMRPHNLGLTMLGTGMLWFGWFGFNAGSALAANSTAVGAFVNTNTAAAAGGLAWMAAEWLYRGRPTTLGLASGAVAGLVGITPAAGYVMPNSAILIGVGAGVFCYLFVVLKARLGYDDTLDTFGVHGIGGTWGAIATGIFAVTALTATSPLQPELGANRMAQMQVQLIAVAATWVYVAVATFILLKVVDLVVGLRVKAEEEETGLDITQHGEEGYIF